MPQQYTAYCIHWIEYERGWGKRPDGISLHATLKDAKQYIKDYWDKMPDEAPYEYSSPSGDPKLIVVSKRLSNEIDNKGSVRYYQFEYDKLLKNKEVQI